MSHSNCPRAYQVPDPIFIAHALAKTYRLGEMRADALRRVDLESNLAGKRLLACYTYSF
jgi:hypothetical protein